MASFVSPVYASISGSVGGVNYCKSSTGGLVARGKSAGDKAKTNNRTLFQSAVSNAAQRWFIITPKLRDGWNAYAKTVIFRNSGGYYIPSGYQVFTRNVTFAYYYFMRKLYHTGVNPIPPTTPGDLKLANVGFNNTGLPSGRFRITWSNPNTEPVRAFFTRSRRHPETSNLSQGDLISSSTLIDVAPPDSPVQSRLFTGLTPGGVYFVRVRGMNDPPPFRLSPEFWVRAVAS